MDVGQVEFAVLADGLDVVLAKAKELDSILNGMDGKRFNIGGNVKSAARDMATIQRELEHSMVNFGSRMQTLGRTLQNVTSPFTNVLRGFTYGIGYRALNKVLDGFSNAFSRADIMNTTQAVLKLQGYDLSKKFAVGTGKAATAMENLDAAVQGLPTGLDEITASMKVYVGASEDVEKATKMAIAANNAYIASGVDATRKRYSERQLQNLMSGAELTTQQWDSLRKNLPLAMNAVAHELDMTMGDMISDLKNGRLETEKFIDAFIKVGTEGKIYKSAQKLKITWEALSSNISIAFSRMGANILDTLNSVSKKLTGRTFLQHLLGVDAKGRDMGDGIKHIINSISEATQEWIKANPDKIVDFLNDLKNFDWKGMLSEIASFFLTMGKVYGGFIKLLGGKNIAKLMLWGNVIGKAFTVMGGLTRGLAGPISKILTFAGFGKITAIFTGMSEAGEAASAIPISWQNVASKAITIAAIPALAGSLWLVANALQEFMKVDISWGDLQVKLGQAMLAISEFGIMAGALGALISSSGPIGWAGAVAVGAGTLAIAGISATMIAVAKALNDISNVKVPDASKIDEVVTAIKDVGKAFEAKNPFEAIGTILDAWTKGAEFDAVSKVAKAFNSIKQMSKIKIDKKDMKQAKANFKSIGEFISGLETMFDDNVAKEASGATTGALYRRNTNRYSTWQNEVAAFSNIVASVTGAIDGMKGLVKSARKLNSFMLSIKDSMPDSVESNAFSWTVVKDNMQAIADGMYSLISGGQESPVYKLNKVAQQTKDMSLETALSAFKTIPKIIKKMQEIGNIDTGNINLDNLDTLADKISTFIQKISSAFAGGGTFGGGAQGLALDTSAFFSAVNGVKKAIKKLNSLPVAKDMSGVVKSVETAIKQLRKIGTQIIDINITIQGTVDDQVGPKIVAAEKAITGALKSIKNTYKKKVKVKINNGGLTDNVTPAINRAASNIMAAYNSIPGSLTKTVKINIKPGGTSDSLGLLRPHTGGAVGNRLLYKALGGFVFKPHGTDTIPAMLTQGEFVMNRMASNAIGYDVLQRLNHLDIAGAMRGLYTRAAQSIGTINNTKYANLTINNYDAPSIGFVKGNRWVQSI